MTLQDPELGTRRFDGREIASARLPSERTGRTGSPVVHVIGVGPKVQFQITGLDPTDFEAVVGPKKAEEYRAYVHARRSWVKPKAGRRVGRLRGLLRFADRF